MIDREVMRKAFALKDAVMFAPTDADQVAAIYESLMDEREYWRKPIVWKGPTPPGILGMCPAPEDLRALVQAAADLGDNMARVQH